MLAGSGKLTPFLNPKSDNRRNPAVPLSAGYHDQEDDSLTVENAGRQRLIKRSVFHRGKQGLFRMELMTRSDLTASVLEAKRKLGLTWQGIAGSLGTGSLVFYTAALLGQHALTPEEAQKAGELLKLDEAAARMLAEPPEERGASLKIPRPIRSSTASTSWCKATVRR